MDLKKTLLSIIGVACLSNSVLADDDPSYNDSATRYSHSSPIVETQDGSLLWSVVPDLNRVVAVDTSNHKIVAEIQVGREPRSITVSNDGSVVYVVNTAGNSVSRIDVADKRPLSFDAELRTDYGVEGEIITGAEPRAAVLDRNGEYLYVANSSQDTIVAIETATNTVVSALDISASKCNVGDKDRQFIPRAIAIDNDKNFLHVTRFLSYTTEEGVQRSDTGKEGIICNVAIIDKKEKLKLKARSVVGLPSQNAGFPDKNGDDTYAYPNQLGSIVLRDGKAYLPNIAASPTGPQSFDTITQSFVNVSKINGAQGKSQGALNIHLGARDPEPGKDELYFSNPVAIGFDSTNGAGAAYVASGGSDILVKLNVNKKGNLSFTVDQDTTRYIDLNEPYSDNTSGRSAGKNPMGLVVSEANSRAYVLNYVSRNISVVDLKSDQVIDVVSIAELPAPGSKEEVLLVGAEMFFSSRGNFVADGMLFGSNTNRLSEKARQNCASCHADGFTDGVVWQFATGPRKTISVNGTFNPHDPLDQRIINASAIFDEVEDADFNTRLVSSKGHLSSPQPCVDTPPHDSGLDESIFDPDHGLILGDWDIFGFAPCVMNQFEFPNSGRAQPYVRLAGSDVLVKAHDALIDWQRFAIRTPNAAFTRQKLAYYGLPLKGGLRTKAVKRGERLFVKAGCVNCHAGGKWSASMKDFVSPPAAAEIATESGVDGVNPFQFLHRFLNDIGSYNLNVEGEGNLIPGYRSIGGIEVDGAGRLALGFDHNGDGLGNGYNIYSILGAAMSPPYYHNGACETLECVLSDSSHRQAGQSSEVDPLENPKRLQDLAEFLRSIDETTAIY